MSVHFAAAAISLSYIQRQRRNGSSLCMLLLRNVSPLSHNCRRYYDKLWHLRKGCKRAAFLMQETSKIHKVSPPDSINLGFFLVLRLILRWQMITCLKIITQYICLPLLYNYMTNKRIKIRKDNNYMYTDALIIHDWRINDKLWELGQTEDRSVNKKQQQSTHFVNNMRPTPLRHRMDISI